MAVDLVRLAEVVGKMTPAEWRFRPGTRDIYRSFGRSGGGIVAMFDSRRFMDDDAAGIVALRNAAPALIAELEAARKVVEAVRALGPPRDSMPYWDRYAAMDAALADYDALTRGGEALSHDAANEGGGG